MEKSSEQYNKFLSTSTFVVIVIGMGGVPLFKWAFPDISQFVPMGIITFLGGASPPIMLTMATWLKGEEWTHGFVEWLNKSLGFDYRKAYRILSTFACIAGVAFILLGIYLK